MNINGGGFSSFVLPVTVNSQREERASLIPPAQQRPAAAAASVPVGKHVDLDDIELVVNFKGPATTATTGGGGGGGGRSASNASGARSSSAAAAGSGSSSAFARVMQQKAEERRLRRAGEDEVLDDMETIIVRLKTIGSEIHGEFKEHEELLNEMDEQVEDVSTGMELAMRKTDALMTRKGCSHTKVIVWLSGIAFFLFLLIWLS